MEKQIGFTVRRIVVAGVLSAIAILLGFTRWGYIPVPTPAGNATIMHIPVIIGSIMEGWPVGTVIGFIFGLSSFVGADVPFFKDPLVSVLPRLFIGIVSWLVFVGIRRWNVYAAIGVAGFMGSATNTILVLGMAVLRGYLAFGPALVTAVANGLPEAIVSVLITLAVVSAWMRIDRKGRRSKLDVD
ncbi:MAG: ECF transporter S component [Alicyclobacillus sp.]|nr:ECF transporter S component [Alicyclobacillus sp.]